MKWLFGLLSVHATRPGHDRNRVDPAKDRSPLFVPALAIFCAIEVILAFSSFGFVVLEPISFTFLTLPVLAGALALGSVGGLVLGTLFGLATMWKASVSAVSLADKLFSPVASGDPVGSLVLSVGARALFGLCAAWLFVAALKYCRNKRLGLAAATVCADALHKILVYACITTFFPQTGFDLARLAERFFSTNTALNLALSITVVLLVHEMLTSRKVQRLLSDARIWQANETPAGTSVRAALLVFFFLLSLGVWFHFFGRTRTVLLMDGVVLSQAGMDRFWHLGLQFFVTVMAIFAVAVVLLFLGERYILAVTNQARRDMMTGLYNRGTFQNIVEQSLARNSRFGHLLIFDVDDFKQLNDTWGHPFGDSVLMGVADVLLKTCKPRGGIVGRLGGDEFCVFLEGMGRPQLERHLDVVFRYLGHYSRQMHGFTCSVGIALCTRGMTFADGYLLADRALYSAKKTGKNCFVLLDAADDDSPIETPATQAGRNLLDRLEDRLEDGLTRKRALEPQRISDHRP